MTTTHSLIHSLTFTHIHSLTFTHSLSLTHSHSLNFNFSISISQFQFQFLNFSKFYKFRFFGCRSVLSFYSTYKRDFETSEMYCTSVFQFSFSFQFSVFWFLVSGFWFSVFVSRPCLLCAMYLQLRFHDFPLHSVLIYIVMSNVDRYRVQRKECFLQ